MIYAITGITGQVGGETAWSLLEAGQSVRAIVRDARKAKLWAQRKCGIAVAAMEDAEGLAEAFRGADGAFVLLPPVFDPSPDFAEAAATIKALCQALETAKPGKVLCISTIGARAKQRNLLTQLGMMEDALSRLSMPVTLLRPGWFMENARWDVDSARKDGVIRSFLQPLERAIPMVATADVGRTAASLLAEEWLGCRIIEMEGPERVSPFRLAAAFSSVLGRNVKAEVFRREEWEGFFRTNGMKNPESRMRMLDGFNEGWIGFEGRDDEVRKGGIRLEEVIRKLVEETA